MMKKMMSMILAAVMTMTVTGAAASASDEQYSIGISQFAEHGSLDDFRNGFIHGVEEEGFVSGENTTYDIQNANADTGTAATIADSFVANGVNLICAIATPDDWSIRSMRIDGAEVSARQGAVPGKHVEFTAVRNK